MTVVNVAFKWTGHVYIRLGINLPAPPIEGREVGLRLAGAIARFKVAMVRDPVEGSQSIDAELVVIEEKLPFSPDKLEGALADDPNWIKK